METVNDKSQIYPVQPMMKFYSKEDPTSEISITRADFDTFGNIVIVYDVDGKSYYAEDLIIYQDFLDVPGVGYLRPGTKVKLDSDKTLYSLQYGWHTNISNQTIYSWYLHPITEFSDNDKDTKYMSEPEKVLSQDRTLYRHMIDHLWEVTV